jgi:ParB/RepB/Spo0J family partition protein
MVEGLKTLAAERKSRAKAAKVAKPSKPAVNIFESLEIIMTAYIPVANIVPSRHNPRKVFDERLITRLSQNIADICELNPITIRQETNELIDGETRLRAAIESGVPALRCIIVKCTDEQAAIARLQSSMDRAELNAIDKGRAFQAMLEQQDLTQRELAEMLGIDQSTIANLTRLLKLPGEWQDKVIAGEITGSAARDLVPWANEPAVLDNLLKRMISMNPDKFASEFRWELQNAIELGSRPMKGSYLKKDGSRWCSVVFTKLSDADRELLRIRKIKFHDDGPEPEEERAFNVELWQQLQDGEEDLRVAKLEKREAIYAKNGTAAKNVDAKKAEELSSKSALKFSKDLFEHKIWWLQSRLVDWVQRLANEQELAALAMWFAMSSGAGLRGRTFRNILRDDVRSVNNEDLMFLMKCSGKITTDPDDYWKKIRQLLAVWISENDYRLNDSAFPSDAILKLANEYEIHIAEQWTFTLSIKEESGGFGGASTVLPQFLKIFTVEGLKSLAAEWKILLSSNSLNRQALIAEIESSTQKKPAPKCLVNVKPCSLV